MKKSLWSYIGLIIILTFINNYCQKKDNARLLEDFLNKKKDVTILVTDSGLGGMSVMADMASRLSQSRIFRNVKIVFFSALFKEKSGYNSLKKEEDKLCIFNNVLKAMKKKYHPDLLLIACNTLSVLHKKTPFFRTSPFPMVGVVEAGVDAIAEEFEKHPEAVVLIFATRTTIDSEAHKNILIERGYSAHQITGQKCHRLAGAINRGHESEETMALIREYVSQALKKLDSPDTPFFVSLNCTDYGYSIQQFKDVFSEKGYPEVKAIDPNPRMLDFLFKEPYLKRHSTTHITLEVVSKVVISDEMLKSVGMLLECKSPATAQALISYKLDPELFEFELRNNTFIE